MTDAPFDHVLTSEADLRQLYREPVKVVANKKSDRLDPAFVEFIARSPFVMVATADADGRTTVSPKGGAPGFVTVLDERRLAIPDYVGNNLLDGLGGLVQHPEIALCFLMPGQGETVRIQGKGYITTDPAVLEALAENTAYDGSRAPARAKSAIGVAVETAFVHCAAAFNRSKLWDPSTWPSDEAHVDTLALIAPAVRRNMPADEVPDWAAPEPTPS